MWVNLINLQSSDLKKLMLSYASIVSSKQFMLCITLKLHNFLLQKKKDFGLHNVEISFSNTNCLVQYFNFYNYDQIALTK